MAHITRRVVTHQGDNGRSRILFDGDAPVAHVFDELGGLTISAVWDTAKGPANNTGTRDAAQDWDFEPEIGSGGTSVEVVELPPGTDEIDADNVAGISGMMADDDVFTPSERHALMHKTTTLDYIFIMKGEVWAILDDEETLLKAGDILVQRGTNHSWSNRSDKPCIMAAVMVSADPI